MLGPTWEDDVQAALDGLDVAALEASTTEEPPPSPRSEQRRKQREAFHRHSQRTRTELAFLTDKVSELKEKLELLHAKRAAVAEEPAKWELLAKAERKRRQDAMDQNDELRASLHQQVDFAHSLVRIVSKRPRSLYPSSYTATERTLTLPMEPCARMAAYHAITDSEIAKLDAAYAQAGLTNPTSEFQKNEARFEGDALIVDTIALVYLDCAFDVAVQAGWDVIRGASRLKPVLGEYVHLADIDADMSYFSSLHRPLKAQRRLLVKRYHSPHCVSYVARSIAVDDVFPLDPELAVMDEVAWAQLIEDPATGAVTLKYCQKVHPPLSSFKDAEGPVTMHLMLLFQKITKSYERAIRDQIAGIIASSAPPSG
ncbi:hypothetical protein SDRG_01697 [Saprolegnia diclina VS20]|uniref:START domain-containing protein n=1 Tax=Saprolegnia diclina (strain VS20) TaxID=1156394 RepID=T0S671_SAPDV|nr:hypothetical protein SDRG_01697 [Saprolegnia diclina VS20]EQC40613.1 hypothetical protein SDRG_01697 [Saprolegnia diclina VS20]|eukprot:XP_008605457.1 hypothetical protein SDRG_01697 [Saprolegnia diclina VS20]